MAFLNKIFSIKKDGYTKYITILGIKIKRTNRIKKLEEEIKNLKYKLYRYCPDEKRAEAMKDWYFDKTGEILDLKNPKTFNQKMQWLKLYDSTPIKTRLADKYLVREWVKEKIGEEYLIPLLGVWDKAEDINFDKLPKQFVLKCNHGSGYNIIVKDKSKINVNKIRKQLNEWLNEDFAFKYGFELHYSDIPRKIIAEEYISEIENSLYDYRFFCFSGKCKNIWLDVKSGTPYHERLIFDENWNELNVKVKWPKIKDLVQKPEKFDEMKKLAETLSKGFSLVRVDFYLVKNKICFGEMTFTSMSGLGKFEPKSFDEELGNYIKINN